MGSEVSVADAIGAHLSDLRSRLKHRQARRVVGARSGLLFALAPANRDRDDAAVANDASGGVAVRAWQQAVDRGLPCRNVRGGNGTGATRLIEARRIVRHVVVAG